MENILKERMTKNSREYRREQAEKHNAKRIEKRKLAHVRRDKAQRQHKNAFLTAAVATMVSL